MFNLICSGQAPTLGDLFFSTNWNDFIQFHHDIMKESRQIWQRFDEQLKHLEGEEKSEVSEASLLPSLFNYEETKELLVNADNQDVKIKNDDNCFEVSLNTSNYSPEEIKVDVVNDSLTIEGNHEEKANNDSKYVVRRFIRSYPLPSGCKKESVTTNISKDGMLKISAPKMAIEQKN